ncbi:MAG: hypothetical protein JW395_0046 [Nitrospira sp.]|nr:hypothetical protein [Nitrospira sp.]
MKRLVTALMLIVVGIVGAAAQTFPPSDRCRHNLRAL